jgi:hypothetical protein
MTPEQTTALFRDEVAVWKPVVANFQSRKK